MSAWLVPGVFVLTLTVALAGPPSDVMGPIPLSSTDLAAARPSILPDLRAAMAAGSEGLERLFDELRQASGRGEPRGLMLAEAYTLLIMFGPGSGLEPSSETAAAANALRGPGEPSLTRWVLRTWRPPTGAGAPSKEAHWASVAADLAGAIGERAVRDHDPQPFANGLRAARGAKAPDADVEALLMRALAISPSYRGLGRCFLGDDSFLRKGPASARLLGRVERLAALAPDVAPLTAAGLALEAYSLDGTMGFDPDLAAVARIPRPLLREGLRALKPGAVGNPDRALAWLRLAAEIDDPELAVAAARRIALITPSPAAAAATGLPALLLWARGKGPRPGTTTPHLPRAASYRSRQVAPLLSWVGQEEAPYGAGPLAVDAVLPPRPTDLRLAWRHDDIVAGYAAHGAHDPALDARALDLLERFARDADTGLTDRRVWQAMEADARSLLAAGSRDPMVRYVAALLGCIVGPDAARRDSLDELHASALDLARSPYGPCRAFWALDSRRWMGEYLGVTEPESVGFANPPLARKALMRDLLERILADPTIPDFAAHDAARRAIAAGVVDAPDVAAFARAVRHTEAVALAVEGRVMLEAVASTWGDQDLHDIPPDVRSTMASTLSSAAAKLERALTICPTMLHAALDAITVARDLFAPVPEVMRCVDRARRIAPRDMAAAFPFYDYLLGRPRRLDVPDRVEQVLAALDAMLAERSSWDASAVLAVTTHAQMLLAQEHHWAAWTPEFHTHAEGELLKRYGRFTDPRRTGQIRAAIAHALAHTDGTIRSRQDHGNAALLLFMLGDEKEALRHFVAAGKTVPGDEIGATWVQSELWRRLPSKPEGAGREP